MHVSDERKSEAAPATAQQTAQKNSGSTTLPREKPAPFPPSGFMHGHILVRAKVNPERFTILGSDGLHYTYKGLPKEGDFLNRLGPVIFRPTYNRNATEVSATI